MPDVRSLFEKESFSSISFYVAVSCSRSRNRELLATKHGIILKQHFQTIKMARLIRISDPKETRSTKKMNVSPRFRLDLGSRPEKTRAYLIAAEAVTSNGVLPPIGFLNTESEAYYDAFSELFLDVTSLERHERVCEIVIVENEKMFPVYVLVLQSMTGPPEAPFFRSCIGETGNRSIRENTTQK